MQPIVEYHASAPERFGEGDPVARPWFKAVVVSKLHVYILLGLMVKYANICTVGRTFFDLVFVSQSRDAVGPLDNLHRPELGGEVHRVRLAPARAGNGAADTAAGSILSMFNFRSKAGNPPNHALF